MNNKQRTRNREGIMKLVRVTLVSAVLLGTFMAAATYAATRQADEQQFTPFRIAGNLYYVGATGHGSYLIATPQGLIPIHHR
jgi:hypothetical protein